MVSGRKVIIEFLGKDTSLSQVADQAGRKTSRLGGILKNAGKAAAVGLAAGAVVAGKALFDMTKAAAEDEAAAAKLAQTLRNSAGATDAQIAATEDWISAQGKALGVTDDELRPALQRLVEATGDVGEAQKLASLAMDVSAGTGKSLKTVSEALMKAQNGQVSGLSRLGIETKNAKGETLTFEQATRKMAETFKGQAEKQADTLQGKMARLKLILGETGEEIGAKLIPVVTRMADWFLNQGLPAIERFGAYLGERLPPIFARIQQVVNTVMGALRGDVGSNLRSVKGMFSDAVTIITRLWNLFGKNIVQYLRSTFNNVVQVLRGAFKIVRGIFKVVAGVLTGDWSKAWDGIKDIVGGAKDVIVGLVKQLGNLLRFAFKNIGVALRGVWNATWDGIKNLARSGADWLVDQVRAIPGRIRGLVGSFLGAGKALIQAFVDGMKNATGIVSGIAGNVWSAVKSLLNSAISKLRSALNFTIGIPGPDIHVNVGDQIPYLAKGTNFHRGGLAVVGEEGPELVHLPRGARVTPHGESMGALRGLPGGGVTVNVYTGVGDPVAIGREVEKVLIQMTRATGRPLQVRTV